MPEILKTRQLTSEQRDILKLPKKKELTPQDRMWITHINRTFKEAITLGKGLDEDKLYGDYHLLIEFFEGDEDAAGEYFMKYCYSVQNCPRDFLKFCEDKLRAAGINVPPRPLEEILGKDPEEVLVPYLVAAE